MMDVNKSNSTIPDKTTSFDLGEDALLLVQVVCYAIIVLVAVVGNFYICFVVLKRKQRKSSDCFILNLAISDLAVGFFSIPLDIAETFSRRWPYWDFMCKLVYPFQTVLMAVSVTTLFCMSAERYRAVVTPLKSMPSKRSIQFAIIAVWIIGFLLATPYSLMLQMKDGSCMEQWPGENFAKVYTMCVFVILYFLPLMLITVLYTLVALTLHKGARRLSDVVQRHGEGAFHMKKIIRKRNKQNIHIVKVFVAAVVAFALCQLPTHVMWLWHDYGDGGGWEYFSNVLPLSSISTYLNSAVDPFIFGRLHMRNWRNSLRAFVSRYIRSKKEKTRSVEVRNSRNAAKRPYPSSPTLLPQDIILHELESIV